MYYMYYICLLMIMNESISRLKALSSELSSTVCRGCFAPKILLNSLRTFSIFSILIYYFYLFSRNLWTWQTTVLPEKLSPSSPFPPGNISSCHRWLYCLYILKWNFVHNIPVRMKFYVRNILVIVLKTIAIINTGALRSNIDRVLGMN